MASESLNSPGSELRDQNRQREETLRSPQPAPRTSSAWFPMGYKEGFNQWWSCIPAAAAEHKVLSYLPYLQHNPPTHLQTGNTADSPPGSSGGLQSADPSQQGDVTTNSLNDPYGPRRWRSTMVELSGKNRALNEFSVERVGEEADQHLVVLHGYGAGLGFFYKNFEPLSRLRGWQLHALDMLGMGRSTRPPFRIKAKKGEEATREAEDWFIDALEEWRIKRKIDRFTLLGHSLGGYMAVAYALKYPGRLNKLILASPVGVPEDPFAVDSAMPEPTESTMANEFTQDQNSITESSSVPPPDFQQKSDGNTLLTRQTVDRTDQSDRPPRRTIPKWFAYLWDANVSPFSLVRWTGPLGPRIVSGWTSRRFSHLPTAEAKALHDYSYSIFSQKGSGEYALTYILAPGAFARSPLIRRIEGVGRQILQQQPPPSPPVSNPTENPTIEPSQQPAPLSSESPSESPSESLLPTKRENGIPIIFMYGDHDWMDVGGGVAAKVKIDEEKRRALENATAEERAADKGSAKVVVIKKAGHHVYLDAWEEFNDMVLAEMEDVSQSEKGKHP